MQATRNISHRPWWAAALVCLVPLWIHEEAGAQEAGSWVVVVAESSLKVRDEVVGTLYPGTIHRVTQSNGKWLALEGQRGWLDGNFARDVETAAKMFQQRAAAQPSDMASFSALGAIYFHLGEYPASIEAYNQALRLDSKRPQLFNNRGLTLSAQGRFELAEKDFQTAIKLAPKYAQAYSNLGWLYFKADKLEQAIEQYNKAIELEKDNPRHYINRGGSYREMGKLDQAMQDFEQAVKISGNSPDGYVGQSTVLMDQLNLNAAIQAADKALELEATNVQAMINRGWAKHLLGDTQAALADLNQALQWDGNSIVALINRSAVHLELKNFAAAAQDLARAKKLDAEHPGVWLNQGELYWQEGKYVEAKQAYEKSLSLGPELAEAQNAMAWFLATCPEQEYRQGAPAVQLATKALRTSQNKDWSHLDTLAAAHANTGQYPEAIRAAEAALLLAPERRKPDVQARLELYRNNQPYRRQ